MNCMNCILEMFSYQFVGVVSSCLLFATLTPITIIITKKINPATLKRTNLFFLILFIIVFTILPLLVRSSPIPDSFLRFAIIRPV